MHPPQDLHRGRDCPRQGAGHAVPACRLPCGFHAGKPLLGMAACSRELRASQGRCCRLPTPARALQQIRRANHTAWTSHEISVHFVSPSPLPQLAVAAPEVRAGRGLPDTTSTGSLSSSSSHGGGGGGGGSGGPEGPAWDPVVVYDLDSGVLRGVESFLRQFASCWGMTWQCRPACACQPIPAHLPSSLSCMHCAPLPRLC